MRFIFLLLLAGCVEHHNYEHFKVESDHNFMESYVYTELKDVAGKPIPGSGRLSITCGYGCFISDTLRTAAMVGSAALIGPGGLAKSGDRNNTRINNNNNGQSNANAESSSSANVSSTANASSSAEIHAPPQSGGHHFHELKPHEYKSLGLD